ncbi:hypothetical protein PVK06_001688 [Gossypium arboreum]|uniref:RNase H type-1 domain-containing protein n=1 Tax=Gossypium arboreum TaxID=29729 RepID=A0ABR0R308_GOSAR|nr:hypothetical protein PVK06_001688 [Gossypium arboreum]
MCYPKGMGGIGFRDMYLFNISLLGRQVWWLMLFKDTLCFKVLSAKYFSVRDVLRPKYYEKPSFTWSSIAKAIDALKDGFLWQIGDGNSIDLKRDHWGIEGLNGDSICWSELTNEERKVKDLWDYNNGQWKKDRVMELYGKNMGDLICYLPILHNEPPVIPSIPMHKRWTKPPDGVIKINVDAAVVNGNVGYGAIARNHDGFVIGGCYSFANKSQDVNWAEFEAFVEGLNLSLKLKVDKIILECDSAYLVNAVKKKDQDITILGYCLNKSCRKFRNFTSVQVNWISRCSNKASDFLCNLAIKNKCNFYFNMDYPMEIHSIIINDAIN